MGKLGGVPPVRAVIFDLDDTLFDDHACMHAGLVALEQLHPPLAGRGRTELMAEYQAALAHLLPEWSAGRLTLQDFRHRRFELLFGQWGVAGVSGADGFATFRAGYQAARGVVAGVPELLAAVRARGVRVGVLTNFTRPEQVAKLDHCGLSPFIDALVTTDEGPPKPHPASYKAVLKSLGVPAAEAVMVGDSWVNDVIGARAVGLRAVWFERFGGVAELGDVPVLRAYAPLDEAIRVLLDT